MRCMTVTSWMKWNGINNGDSALAASNGFDAIISAIVDWISAQLQTLRVQSCVEARIESDRDLRPLMPQLLKRWTQLNPCTLVYSLKVLRRYHALSHLITPAFRNAANEAAWPILSAAVALDATSPGNLLRD